MQQLISNTTILVSKILNTSTSLEIMSPQAPNNPTITLQSSKLSLFLDEWTSPQFSNSMTLFPQCGSFPSDWPVIMPY